MVRLILVILRVNTCNSGNSLGLYLFFLPQYSSEMNLIEAQWHQLKTHEIAGRIFDNEYDLAIAIINGMENRSQQGGWILERLMFKSA
jgi:transposase